MKVAILGAGLMGQVMALTLLRRESYEITLFDDGKPSAARAAAGMIAPFTELNRAEWWIAELGQQSLALWPTLLDFLDKAVYFRQQGALVCAHPQDQAELGHYCRHINRYANKVNYKILSGDDLWSLEPELKAVSQACYFPQEGQIDGQQFLLLAKQFLASRVKLSAMTDSRPGADCVIDCRGLGAKAIFSDLRGIRGESLWLQTDAVKLSRPVRLLHPRYSIYLVPRPDNIYVLGASEIEAEDHTDISVRSMMELLSAAYSIHKGFLEARIIHSTTACRPALANHLPKIKCDSESIAINGLYRHGFSLAPALANEVLAYLEGGLDARKHAALWEVNE